MRINAVTSPYFEEDLRALLGGKRLPDALVVPKASWGTSWGTGIALVGRVWRLRQLSCLGEGVGLLVGLPRRRVAFACGMQQDAPNRLRSESVPLFASTCVKPSTPGAHPGCGTLCLQLDSPREVDWLYSRINALGGERLREAGKPLPLLVMCESGMGMLNLR